MAARSLVLHPALRTLALFLAVAAVACGGGSAPIGTTTPPPGGGPVGVPPPATGGGTSDPGTKPPTTTPPPPAAAISNVSAGAIVSGQVPLNASVPATTVKVDFQLDGAALASVSAAPFSTTWNTFATPNGAHTLSLRASDAKGVVTDSAPLTVTLSNHIKNVFVIMMENSDWASVRGSPSAPYINGTMMAQGAHAENYMNVPNLHPSLPNYLWLESGGTQGVADDDVPANHRLSTRQHLTTLLNNAGVSWKAYQEDIDGRSCPLDYVNRYAPKHNPMVYFTDTNGGVNPSDPYCIAHVRPYGELTNDLETNAVPAYSFITPNLCNDMHDCGIAAGDAWLAREVPKILGSKAYRDGGAILLVWDESAGSNVPIGMVVMSPLAKAGYTGNVRYTHSSTLRTLQDVFGVNAAYLGDAANATDLRDLFKSYP